MARNRPATKRAYRRHAVGLVATFAGVMLVFSLVNTWVNPLWVTPAPWTDNSFADHRQIYKSIRTAKAGLVRSLDWDVAMLGSSRVAIGLDPDLPQWGDTRAVNLGISGGSISENVAMGEYVLEHQSEIEKLIIGLDLTDLTSDIDLARNAGFFESPLSDQGDAFERELRYVVGVSSFDASVKTLIAKHTDEVTPYTAKGHWARNRSVDPVPVILKRDSVPFAMRYIRMRKRQLELSERKTDALRRTLRACLERQVELVVFIPPNHAAYLCVFPLENDPDPFFMIDRRAIVRIVAEEQAKFPDSPPVTVWDFNDYHPLNCESIPPPERHDEPMKYWVDGTHALETLGNVMLARIHGWPLEDPVEASYGEIIDTGNIDLREAQIKEGYQRYQTEHRRDWLWVQSVMKEYASTADDTEAP